MSEDDLIELAKLQFHLLAQTISQIADKRGEKTIIKMSAAHGAWTVGSALMAHQEATP